MAYDEELAERIREELAAERGITEKKMFGGLAFLLHGNMAVAVSGQGGLLARVDSKDVDDLLARPGTDVAVMGGREMHGWLRVTGEAVADDAALEEWVTTTLEHVRTLPPKMQAKREYG